MFYLVAPVFDPNDGDLKDKFRQGVFEGTPIGMFIILIIYMYTQSWKFPSKGLLQGSVFVHNFFN